MKKSAQAWAADKGVQKFVLVGAMRHNKWAEVGEELTEEEFDAGLRAFLEEPLR